MIWTVFNDIVFVLQALQYFEQLKSSTDGWKLCAQALTAGAYEGYVAYLMCSHPILVHMLMGEQSVIEQKSKQNRFVVTSLYV